MKAEFSLRVPPGQKSESDPSPKDPVEYVEITGLSSPAETVHRKATDKDRLVFAAEYAAFKGGAEPSLEPKEETHPE